MFSFNLSKQSAFLAFAMSLAVMACQKDKETKPQVSEVMFKNVQVHRFHHCGMPAIMGTAQDVAVDIENTKVTIQKCCNMEGLHDVWISFELLLKTDEKITFVDASITDLQASFRAGVYAEKEPLYAENGVYMFKRSFDCALFNELAGSSVQGKLYQVKLRVIDEKNNMNTYNFVWNFALKPNQMVAVDGEPTNIPKPCM
jgi:hypothetical protein